MLQGSDRTTALVFNLVVQPEVWYGHGRASAFESCGLVVYRSRDLNSLCLNFFQKAEHAIFFRSLYL